MNENVKKHVIAYCEKEGFGTAEKDLIEIIQDAPRKDRREVDRHRWYTEYWYTVEIDGMFVGYVDAESDDGRTDGYEFDADTIREMEKVEKTVTVYQEKKS